MSNAYTHRAAPRTALAAALLAVFGTAGAQDDAAYAQLTRPMSEFSVGGGYLFNDNSRFGQYNGLTDRGLYGLLDADIRRRDEATGTWLLFKGRNLGLDNRELLFEQRRQGDWGYFIEFGQTPRYDPYTPITAVTGIGSSTLVIPTVTTTGVPVEQLSTRRDRFGLGFDKQLPANMNFRATFRNEEKSGERLFARGSTGGGLFGNFEFAPEPIDSTTRQLEAILSYNTRNLQLSGGYYGTTYDNHHNGLNFVGGAAGLATFNPIALPPDNSSHQLHLTGGYSFTPTTRGTFKVAYAKAIQENLFVTGANVPLAPGIGNNLQGRVDTTLVQAGITSRPIPKLSLVANLRYEDRDDRTPVRRYNTLATGTSTFNGDNEPRSIKTTSGKLEASYALPMSFRVTGGIDYEEKDRTVSPVRIVSARETTDETSYRVELRRSMAESVTGALAYVHSDRRGSDFLQTTLNNGTPGSNLIAPIWLADRDRDKIRLSVNWAPTDPLSFQFLVDLAKDDYEGGRNGSGLGPREGKARVYSIDAAYAFSEAIQGTAWIARNENALDQTTCENASGTGVCPGTAADPRWSAALRNVGNSFGLGLRGKANERLELGGELSFSDITDEYTQTALTPGAAVASLPDVDYKQTMLRLFGRYALNRNMGIRLDYIYDRWSTNDWSWTTWRYVDGTVIVQDPKQTVHFIGVTFNYRYW